MSLTCRNIGVPSSKAKYNKFSDSEKYCKGKNEKKRVNNPRLLLT